MSVDGHRKPNQTAVYAYIKVAADKLYELTSAILVRHCPGTAIAAH
jgi:uncharacterized protein YaaR (DUF327 family)